MTVNRANIIVLLVMAAVAVVIWLIWPRHNADAAAKKNPAPLVSLVTAEQRSLPLSLSTQGHVVALNLVDIQPQITGTVKGIAFKEGDFVHPGQLLFTLDDASQQAALRHAQATQLSAQALLNKAERDLKRSQPLRAKNYLSQSDWDTLQSNLQQYQAQYRAAQQDVRSAEVNLGYTRIFAPVEGKSGALNVHPGSLVQPGSTLPLVSINQFDPIGVAFTLPEQNLNAILRAQSQGPVQVWIVDASGQQVAGKLNFIDNNVAPGSGTITLKAQFDNAQGLLWPGLYQAVRIDAGTTPDAVVLPPQAVQNGPDGHFVYTVDAQHQAQVTPITLLRIQQQLAVVNGLAQGTAVVAEGASNLRPGEQVSVAGAPAKGGQPQ